MVISKITSLFNLRYEHFGYWFGLARVFQILDNSGKSEIIHLLPNNFQFGLGSESFGFLFGLDGKIRSQNTRIFLVLILFQFWFGDYQVVRVIQVKYQIFQIKYRIVRSIYIKFRIFQVILDKKIFGQFRYFIIIQFFQILYLVICIYN